MGNRDLCVAIAAAGLGSYRLKRPGVESPQEFGRTQIEHIPSVFISLFCLGWGGAFFCCIYVFLVWGVFVFDWFDVSFI